MITHGSLTEAGNLRYCVDSSPSVWWNGRRPQQRLLRGALHWGQQMIPGAAHQRIMNELCPVCLQTRRRALDFKASAACGCLERCLSRLVPVTACDGAEKFGERADCLALYTALASTHLKPCNNKTSSCPSARQPQSPSSPLTTKGTPAPASTDPTHPRPQLTRPSAACAPYTTTTPPPLQINNHGRRCRQHAHLQARACW
jgi:hypothetical protein